jgi:hypothetical protein
MGRWLWADPKGIVWLSDYSKSFKRFQKPFKFWSIQKGPSQTRKF